MKTIAAKMTSYIRSSDEKTFHKIVYKGEEVILLAYNQRSFKFNSEEGVRIIRLIKEDESLTIKESLKNCTIDIELKKNDFGSIKYFQDYQDQNLSGNFKTSLKNFHFNDKEIFIHYFILDDLMNKLSESKIYITLGEN